MVPLPTSTSRLTDVRGGPDTRNGMMFGSCWSSSVTESARMSREENHHKYPNHRTHCTVQYSTNERTTPQPTIPNNNKKNHKLHSSSVSNPRAGRADSKNHARRGRVIALGIECNPQHGGHDNKNSWAPHNLTWPISFPIRMTASLSRSNSLSDESVSRGNICLNHGKKRPVSHW